MLHDLVVWIYSFKLPFPEQKDVRLEGIEIGLLMFFVPRMYVQLFEQTNLIEEFFDKKFASLNNIGDLINEYREIFAETREFLLKLLRNLGKKLEL